MIQKIRPIAIYLPQYHPIPENDEWWGKGFTEWTNVTKAKPLFKGHYQPHLPADLGFYDLRLEETRIAQAELAKAYGIHGFCYYHYWFNGKRILERPFQEVFESGKPDFPFMLCWANENWTRVWDGGDKQILLEQKYSEDDDRQHIKSLIPYFKDSRYIKIEGKPVFSIYRSGLMPNIKATVRIWREEAKKAGIDLYLCRFETFGQHGKEYVTNVFDASIDFEPFSEVFKKFNARKMSQYNSNYSLKIQALFAKKIGLKSTRDELVHKFFSRSTYEEYVNFYFDNYTYSENYIKFPGATPSWDNTARRKEKSILFKDSTPDIFEKWLHFHKKNFQTPSPEENFIFINAWNEWAEGNHLEPCQKWGTSYLNAVKRNFG